MAILKDLIVHGSSRFLNKIYANELETPLINADEARFTKLIAKDASLEDVTVTGLLDAQGQLHTNTWTNSNISTIEGSFYIMPTLSNMTDSDSNVLTFIASTLNSYPIVSVQIGSNQAFAGMGSLQFETVTGIQNDTVGWTGGSKVLLTGEVKVGSEWLPLGTIVGTLNSFNNDYSSIEIVDLKDNKGRRPAPILLNFPLSSQIRYRNLKISLCERYISGNSKYYPIGIYMTALGSNGKTFLDIYGGGQEANVDNAGGLARPNVRIGNLNGLPSIGNQTPHGWGIYTTHGYFSGTVVADTGNIGGWSLTADSIWKGNQAFKNSEGMYFGSAGISLGSTFSVSNSGVLTATNGHIGGWTLTQEKLSIGELGEINSAVINPGTELEEAREIGGSEELSNWIFTAGANFGVTGDGTLYANNANITGTINATSGNIGGIEIVDGRLQGENFGIESNGDIYINNANVTGTIIATSGNIGGIEIDENGKLNLSSLSIGEFKDANEYAQKEDIQFSKKITTYYLASSKSSDVVFEDEGWSLTTPTVDENKKYLWAYQVRKGKENHDEGSIISFENDGDSILFDSLIVDIEPVQDLHGQDAPYPAGGGKNKFGGVYGENFELHIANGTVVTAYADKACTIAYYDSDGSTRIDYWSINTAVTGGYARTFTMIGDSSYFRFLSASDTPTKMQIELSSSFTGYAPYSNICPISGWTGVTVQRTGINLLDLSNLRKGNYSGATNNTNVSFDEHQPIKGGQTYVWSNPLNDIAGRYLKFYDADKIELSGEVNLYGVGAKTFSVPSNARYFRCLWYRGTGIEPTDIVADQIELGSTATPYEPYQGNTYSVDWTDTAGTVYGGTIDVVSGVLTVDQIYFTDIWGNGANATTLNSYERRVFSGLGKSVYPNYATRPISNVAPYTASWAGEFTHFYVNDDTVRNIVVILPQGTDDNTVVQVVYELAEPITYHLTPSEVKSLLGQNHVWADTGDVELTYSTNAVRGNPYLIGMEDVNGAVNSLQTDVDSLSTQIDNYGNWIDFDISGANPVMKLGNKNSDISATFTNEELQFKYKDTVVAYIKADSDGTGKLFATNSLVLKETQFGNWAWYQRENGHLSVKWKGGSNS